MISLTLPAPAKINLTLDILGARPDGYHEMEMVMQSVSLCDTIRLDLGFAGGVRASSGLQFLPNDKDNLAVAAALAFRKATGQTWRDLLITIEKRIPVCAGTAGGSSDAAAVLRGLNELTNAGLSPQALAKIGEEVGSDVPYCVLGTTALAGETEPQAAAVLLDQHLDDIAQTAAQEISAQGHDDRVEVRLEQTWFPTRQYQGISLPAGNYLALRVLIGAAEGHNWWCVVFPNLCLPAVSERALEASTLTPGQISLLQEEETSYVFRFKTLELWQSLKHRLMEG